MHDGVVSSLSHVVGGAGPPLPFVGRGGGCWVLVAGHVPALLCGVGVLSWLFVDAGGCGGPPWCVDACWWVRLCRRGWGCSP